MSKTYSKMLKILKENYPEAQCSLDFKTPFQLCIAVMLSAQCTDERVNKVTPVLFKKFNTPAEFANADLVQLENLIHSCGFYKNKAKNIKACSEQIISKFHGNLPNNIDDLMSLPGVGRKSANVIMLEAFNSATGIAVDTHAKRLSNRIGLSGEQDPIKIEQDLLKIFSPNELKDVNHLLVYHGRNCCNARSPKCTNCPIYSFCNYFKNNFTKKSNTTR